MGRLLLKPVFYAILERKYSGSIEDQKLLQPIVYLLKVNGVELWEYYNFYWYEKIGPYSQVLKNDVIGLDEVPIIKISYDNYTAEQMLNLKYVLEKNGSYTLLKWANCLASVHYIENNFFNKGVSEEIVLKELVTRKPNLNDDKNNHLAYKLVKTYLTW